jgi:hypothetical protein
MTFMRVSLAKLLCQAAMGWIPALEYMFYVDVFCTDKNWAVKITCSSSDVIMRTRKQTVIYPTSVTSLKVIALRLVA